MSRVLLENVCGLCRRYSGSSLPGITGCRLSRTSVFRSSLVQSYATSSQESVLNVFDRNAKRKQRNRTAFMDNYNVYEYVKEEVSFPGRC